MPVQMTNCYNCHNPLGLYDLRENVWHDDYEEFIFVCPNCEKQNKIISNLFKDGHINLNYLALFKDNPQHFPEKQKSVIEDHIHSCEECSARINELILSEIEEKIRFNEESLKYFESHGQTAAYSLTGDQVQTEEIEGLKIVKCFKWNGDCHDLNQVDEFYRQTGPLFGNPNVIAERVVYYMFEDHWLLGMVSFIFYESKVILERIWFKPDKVVKLEKKFIQDLKNRKANLKLAVLRDISKIIHSSQG